MKSSVFWPSNPLQKIVKEMKRAYRDYLLATSSNTRKGHQMKPPDSEHQKKVDTQAKVFMEWF